jgi:hypothetical protein
MTRWIAWVGTGVAVGLFTTAVTVTLVERVARIGAN